MGRWDAACWSVTSTRQCAQLAQPCYHPSIITYPLRPKGVRRWRRWTALVQQRLLSCWKQLNIWAPLITGIPSTLRNSEKCLHPLQKYRHCWDCRRASNAQCCQAEREEKCCLLPAGQEGAWAACVRATIDTRSLEHILLWLCPAP